MKEYLVETTQQEVSILCYNSKKETEKDSKQSDSVELMLGRNWSMFSGYLIA